MLERAPRLRLPAFPARAARARARARSHSRGISGRPGPRRAATHPVVVVVRLHDAPVARPAVAEVGLLAHQQVPRDLTQPAHGSHAVPEGAARARPGHAHRRRPRPPPRPPARPRSGMRSAARGSVAALSGTDPGEGRWAPGAGPRPCSAPSLRPRLSSSRSCARPASGSLPLRQACPNSLQPRLAPCRVPPAASLPRPLLSTSSQGQGPRSRRIGAVSGRQRKKRGGR